MPSRTFTVNGRAMEPTVALGQIVVIDTLAYGTACPGRGDLILMKYPLRTQLEWIKRVIGLPGETVSVHDGAVLINGHALVEPYLPSDQRPHYELEQVAVPAHHLFVLGDKRDNSYDSHSWGMLDKALVIGKVVQVPGERDQ